MTPWGLGWSCFSQVSDPLLGQKMSSYLPSCNTSGTIAHHVIFCPIHQKGILPSPSHIMIHYLQHIDYWMENYVISHMQLPYVEKNGDPYIYTAEEKRL